MDSLSFKGKDADMVFKSYMSSTNHLPWEDYEHYDLIAQQYNLDIENLTISPENRRSSLK